MPWRNKTQKQDTPPGDPDTGTVYFAGANLTGAVLHGKISNADFRSATCFRTQFRGVVVSGSLDFRGADLTDACFDKAVINDMLIDDRTVLVGATFRGARVSGKTAKGLRLAVLGDTLVAVRS